MILHVAGAFICEQDRFLICKRPDGKANGGLWEFPGGKLESGETPAQAAVRECREELAIELAAESDPIAETYFDKGELTIHLMLVKCRIIGGHIRLLEHSDAQWILPEEYPKYKFCPADILLIKLIFPYVSDTK